MFRMLFLILVVFSSYHQVISQTGIKSQILPEVGLNVATIRHNLPMQGVHPRVAYHYGIGIRLFINQEESLAIHYGGTLSLRGYNQDINGAENNFQLNYITMPVMLVWQVAKPLALMGGFEGGLRYNARFRNKYGSRGIGDFYSDFDLGLLGGLHLWPRQKFGIYFRTSYGLLNLSRQIVFDPIGNEAGTLWHRNLVFQTGLSINVPKP